MVDRLAAGFDEKVVEWMDAIKNDHLGKFVIVPGCTCTCGSM